MPEMSVSENIFLNEKPTKYGFIDFDKMYVDSMALLRQIGMNTDDNIAINPDEKVRNLGIGQKQMVEIAKALAKDVRLLILDEPTAALTEAEVDVLLDIIDKLRKEGVTCIYISHRLDEVMRISDDITVLRDGQTVETRKRADLDKDTMISLMVGRELTNMFPRVPHTRGDLVLEVNNYSVENPDIPGKILIDNVSLKAYKGEILGMSGLMGAGRTELFTAIFGAFREPGRGEVKINGADANIKSPIEVLLWADGQEIGEPSKDFIRKQGYEDLVETGKDLLAKYRDKILLPTDYGYVKDGIRHECKVLGLPDGELVVDIGSETAAAGR